MPKLVIVAGPNGAGKTTFASEYFAAQEHWQFVNADEIARILAGKIGIGRNVDVLAARAMLDRIDELAKNGTDFAFETTLATLTYARKIPLWQRAGYVVALIYLRLPNAEASVERVRRRVDAGGHSIPEEVIRRRFDRSNACLEKIYKPTVDEWYVWDSQEGTFVQKERWDQT
jgi:predicted ABC-type ATPase